MNKQSKTSEKETPRTDKERDERNESRVNKRHGGTVVESIAPEDLEVMNDPTCTHETAVRDFSEEDFLAFKCANPKCGLVKLFDKPKV